MWIFCVAFARVRLGFCGVSTEDSARTYRIRPTDLVAFALPGFGYSPRFFLRFSGGPLKLLQRIHRAFAEASRTLVARVRLGRMDRWLSMFRIGVLCGDSAELLQGIYRVSRSGCRGSTGLRSLAPSIAKTRCGTWPWSFREVLWGFYRALTGLFRKIYREFAEKLQALMVQIHLTVIGVSNLNIQNSNQFLIIF